MESTTLLDQVNLEIIVVLVFCVSSWKLSCEFIPFYLSHNISLCSNLFFLSLLGPHINSGEERRTFHWGHRDTIQVQEHCG